MSSDADEFSSSDSGEDYHPLSNLISNRRGKHPKKSTVENGSIYNVFSFLLGATLSVPFVMIICSAEDMLSGSRQPTGLVFIAATAPSCIMKVVFLCCGRLRAVSLVARSLLMYILVVVGMLFMAMSQIDHCTIRYVGVGVISLGVSIGEVSLLIVTATKFSKKTVCIFMTGSALGGILGALPYVGMTTWSDVNPRAALLVPIVWPTLHLLCFAAMQMRNYEKSSSKITYQDPNDNEVRSRGKTFYVRRFMAVWKVLDRLLLLYLSYCSVFLSLGAILTTLVFRHDVSFGPRGDYQHYVLSTIIGQFFGRSLMSIWLGKFPKTENSPYKAFGAFFSTFFMLLLFWASWNRFIHNIWGAFVVCFFQGTSLGILSVISYYSIAHETSTKHVDFVLTLASLMETVGILCAGLVGLHTEPSLLRHCTELTFGNTTKCLTRTPNSFLWAKGSSIL